MLFGEAYLWSAQTSIQNIANVPVSSVAEFVDGGQYVIALKDNGYLYTASHTCAAQGIAANEAYCLKRNGAQPTVGSTDMSKVFTLVVKGDGTYAIKDYQGNYIDNIVHGATTPADPVHTTADECTFTITPKTSPNWGIVSTSTATNRRTLDGGGTDTDGVVLTASAGNGNFAFYRVNFNEAAVAVDNILAASAKEVTYLSQLKNGKQYIIKNFTNGFIYETEHTCAASPESARDDNNKIARGAGTVAAGSADLSYVFTLYVNSDDTYSFKGQTSYVNIPVALSGTIPSVVSNILLGTPTGPVDLSAITGAIPFILGANSLGNVAFYAVSSTDATLAIGKAYLTVPISGGEGTIRLSFGDSLTGIENVATPAEDARVVDLSGRRVNKTTKGTLYISGGKVFIAQ